MHRIRENIVNKNDDEENQDILVSDDEIKGPDIFDMEVKLVSLKEDICKIALKRLDEIKITKNIKNINRFIGFFYDWDISDYMINNISNDLFAYACKNNWNECMHLLFTSNDVLHSDLCNNCCKKFKDHDEIYIVNENNESDKNESDKNEESNGEND